MRRKERGREEGEREGEKEEGEGEGGGGRGRARNRRRKRRVALYAMRPLVEATLLPLSGSQLVLEVRVVDRSGRRGFAVLADSAEIDPHVSAEAMAAFHKRFAHLAHGEELTSPFNECELCGQVVAHRRHGAALLFIDLQAGSHTTQIIVRAGAANAMIALATRRGSTVRVLGQPGRSWKGELSLFAVKLVLLRVPPDADGIIMCAKLVAAGEMATDAAAGLLRCDPDAMGEVSHAIEAAGDDAWDGSAQLQEVEDGIQDLDTAMLTLGDQDDGVAPTALLIRRASRKLAAALTGRRIRARPARYLKVGVNTLDRLTVTHQLPWSMERVDTMVDLEEDSLGVIHPANGLPEIKEADAMLRQQYIQRKKLPQLRWMLAQIEAVLSERGSSAWKCGLEDSPITILDLGCGRADLTLLIAARHPSAHVIGLDSNESSLSSAMQRARVARLTNVSFVLADAATGKRIRVAAEAPILHST